MDEAWPWPDDLDALAAAPEHHGKVLENDLVRVLETRIGPGDTTAVHTHRWPNVQHVVATSDFIRRDGEGGVLFDTREAGTRPEPGATSWSDPIPPHSLENVGGGELHVIMVEVKTGSNPPRD